METHSKRAGRGDKRPTPTFTSMFSGNTPAELTKCTSLPEKEKEQLLIAAHYCAAAASSSDLRRIIGAGHRTSGPRQRPTPLGA
ncbi:hypothetical protein F2P81_011069 [Scophthalmus maximus]|uniref:Uncharacterized protein n=1 Tax=Scophthalmus maximus TaxID=52904 RepID=A0A6A4SQU8_SCOMX|nr:hypothetical protein F2P81_011069 [Scophthalmus maximus]